MSSSHMTIAIGVQCKQCGDCFINSRLLNQHIVECNVAVDKEMDEIKEEDIKETMDIHQQLPLGVPCSECDKRFLDNDICQLHRDAVHKCPDCNLYVKEDLKSHRSSVHPTPPPPLVELEPRLQKRGGWVTIKCDDHQAVKLSRAGIRACGSCRVVRVK